MPKKLFRYVSLSLFLALFSFCIVPSVQAQKPDPQDAVLDMIDSVAKVFAVPTALEDSVYVEAEAKFGNMKATIISAAMPDCGLLQFDIPGIGKLKYVYSKDKPWIEGGDDVLYVGNEAGGFQKFLDANLAWKKARREVINQITSLPLMAKSAAGTLQPKWDGDKLSLVQGSYATFDKDNQLETVMINYGGFKGEMKFKNWVLGDKVDPKIFAPPTRKPTAVVPSDDIYRGIVAIGSFGFEKFNANLMPQKSSTDPVVLQVVSKDKNGHGILCKHQGKQVLIVEGTPEEMGAAQGALLKNQIFKLVSKIMYASGTSASLSKGKWFMDMMQEIQDRTGGYIPERFVAECDALSAAAGISQRDGRYANLFPELFHCSGVAVRGPATVDGRVLHARVLDYMRELLIQSEATVQVFIPKDHYAWISHGYAGFVGSVTAMNEHGLAIGEMGGRGEGNWDGLPMSLLVREIMETCKTVDEAVALMKKTPRTCEYFYVLSDANKNMVGIRAVPEEVLVLQPGEQNPMLPHVPKDTIMMSAGDRAVALSKKLTENHGKIDVPMLIEIIKRPVAMDSNLHNAIFSPETLEIWVSDAGDSTVACDENYAKFNLKELIEVYNKQMKK